MRGASVLSFLVLCLISNVNSAPPPVRRTPVRSATAPSAPPPPTAPPAFGRLIMRKKDYEFSDVQDATEDTHRGYQKHLNTMRDVIQDPKAKHIPMITAAFGKAPNRKKIMQDLDEMIEQPVRINSMTPNNHPKGRSITHSNTGLRVYGNIVGKSDASLDFLHNVSRQRIGGDKRLDNTTPAYTKFAGLVKGTVKPKPKPKPKPKRAATL